MVRKLPGYSEQNDPAVQRTHLRQVGEETQELDDDFFALSMECPSRWYGMDPPGYFSYQRPIFGTHFVSDSRPLG